MSIRTKEEILNAIKTKFSDDTSDETLSFIEDVSDTLEDFDKKVKGDGKDWKAEAEKIDAAWREKYKARFFSGSKEDDEEEEPEEKKSYKFEDLFKE